METTPWNVASGSKITLEPEIVYTPCPATVTEVSEQLLALYGEEAPTGHNFNVAGARVVEASEESLANGEYVWFVSQADDCASLTAVGAGGGPEVQTFTITSSRASSVESTVVNPGLS